ncbi:MAG: glutathione S-transferase family protein [Pseudomonadota bacterium]
MTILLYVLIAATLVALVLYAIEKSRRRTYPVTGGLHESISLPHTHSVELYSNSFSHCSRKARFVVAELGLEVKHHSIDLIETGWYQTISKEYLKVNRAGLVPTLVHNGHPVYESDDILAYAQTIARADAPQLVPHDPALKAKMDEWLSFCAIVSADIFGGMKERAGACIPGLSFVMFMAAIRYIPLRNIIPGFLYHSNKKSPILFSSFKIFGIRGMAKQKRVREMMHTSRDHMMTHLQTLNRTLELNGNSWILGETFSLADITIGCMLLRLEETGWLHWFERSGDIQNVIDYYARIKARPAWAEAITARAHPIVEQAKMDLIQIRSNDPALSELIYGPVASIKISEKEAA